MCLRARPPARPPGDAYHHITKQPGRYLYIQAILGLLNGIGLWFPLLFSFYVDYCVLVDRENREREKE